MIPLRDVIPSRTVPVVTIAIIVVNAVVFVLELLLDACQPDPLGFQPGGLCAAIPGFLQGRSTNEFIIAFGLIPAAFSWITVLTSMFVHGGWLHVGGNMLYLWIFGDNVEDRMGHGRFVAFYLLCGAAAALVQTIMSPNSTIPMVGASGAIAGVMGAYFVMYPHSRIVTLLPIFFFIQIIEVPAILFLGIWFLMQFLSGVGSIATAATRPSGGGVAFWAHVAGFVAGLAGVFVFRRPERQRVDWWDKER